LNGKSWKKQPLSLGAKKGSQLAAREIEIGHRLGTRWAPRFLVEARKPSNSNAKSLVKTRLSGRLHFGRRIFAAKGQDFALRASLRSAFLEGPVEHTGVEYFCGYEVFSNQIIPDYFPC